MARRSSGRGGGSVSTAARAEVLRARLLGWYRRHRRELPWRRTRDPYAVWISEAMLQQTRVEVVEAYFQRFLARFPDVRALAEASEEDVLAVWSGLGYYRRARMLRAAARVIVERHGGRFPDEPEAARALPGVGPYTAGAVLSIAHGRSEPLVDGNVARVLARVFAIDEPAGSPALARAAWRIADELVPEPSRYPERGPGAWNQALMELGSLVCAPRDPRCDACPWEGACLARSAGRTAELPRPARRRAVVDVRLEVLLARSDGRLLLARRPAWSRMAGMWELPTRELARGDGSRSGLWPAGFPRGARLRAGTPLGELAHAITHHRIRARVRAGHIAGGCPTARDAALRLVAPEEAAELPLTGMARKVLRQPYAAPNADAGALRSGRSCSSSVERAGDAGALRSGRRRAETP